MKHGLALILALEKLDPVVDDDPREPAVPGVVEPLPPIRPGAFAGWATRPPAKREPLGEGDPAHEREPGRAPRVPFGGRPLREGPPVV